MQSKVLVLSFVNEFFMTITCKLRSVGPIRTRQLLLVSYLVKCSVLV